MSGVKAEPLALEVTLAHYAASLPEGKSVPLEEIAREFGCSVKELKGALEAVIEVEDRDLTTISGLTIEEGRLVKHLKGGFERDFRRPVRLSPVQARAALLALDLVSKAVDPGIHESLKNKVRGAVGGEVGEVEVGRRFDEDAPVVAAIERARREKRLLEIRYPSRQQTRTRTVEPLMMSNIAGAWYLNAYCRDVEAGRLFRLERIISARVLEGRFEGREGVELKTEYEDIDPRGYAARRAVVRFSAAVARWMEERPELDLIADREDGSADYALYYTDPDWAAKRVMRYLGEAVVLEPPELRREVHRQATALLDGDSHGSVSTKKHEEHGGEGLTNAEVVFCTDWTEVPEEDRRVRAYHPTVFDESEEVLMQYHGFTHEAEVLLYALANAVEEGKITADRAREVFEPYREHAPELYDTEEMEEYENGFPSMDHFMDWGVGPGTSKFWRAADELGIDGVYFNEGEHPGGGPVFYIHRKEALTELRDALAGRYKIVVRKDMGDYDTSTSSDPEEARGIIEQARNESGGDSV